MTVQQGVVLAALAWLVVELLRGRRPPGLVFGGVALLFVLLDYISLKNGLAHFTNPGLVTVVVLLLLGSVLDRVQLLEQSVAWLVRGSYRQALARLMAFTALCSAFLNNTAVVASLMGPLKMSPQHAPSRLLMPMCFAASLGGILTLVGTSTNLLVNGLMVAQGLPALAIFDLFPVGICIVVVCLALMLATMPRLLKHAAPAAETGGDFFVEATVLPGSPLAGRTVTEGGLRRLVHLYLTEIVREGRVIAPVQPEEPVQAGDVLVFCGDVTRLDLLMRFEGLSPRGTHDMPPIDNLCEVVLTADSTLTRLTLKEADFRARFDAAVVAMRRGSQRLSGPIGEIPLMVGDSLVLVTGPDFDKRAAAADDFVVLSRRTLQRFTDAWRGPLALAGFAAVIGLSALGLFDFLKGLLLLLGAFVAMGFVKVGELRRHVPFEIILIIASALVISDVMARSGTAALLAGGVLSLAGQVGPYGALAAVLLLTWLLTELMSNNAAAALMFPVAVGISGQLGLSPLPFVMAALYGASCSFLTPYGYQTNLMIMAPGRYTLGDYVRCGLPVALGFIGTALVMLPLVFPFK